MTTPTPSGSGSGGFGASGNAGVNEAGAAVIAAAHINKLPEFWPDDPTLWFEQIEALFEINGITVDKTKFSYILAYESRYEKFKTRVIQGFSTSEEAKLRKLFKGQNLGDQKPSQFLVVLRNNASGQCNNTILKSLFLEHLPESVRSILAVSDSNDLYKLALMADKIMENQAPSMMISQIKQS